jgi:hypothetical protein
MQPQLGRDVPSRSLQGQGQLGIQGRASAGVQGRVIEDHILAVECESRAAEEFRAVRRQGELRHALVGLHDRRQGGILQRLIRLHVGCGRPPATTIRDHSLAQQVALRSLVDAAAQIPEIGAIRDPVDIQRAAETVAQIVVGVQERVAIALPVGQAVVRQQLDMRHAAVVVVQITEVGVDLQAALGHQTGRDRHVHVGRDVPVIGQGEFDARFGAGAEGRRQEAGFALVVERETEPRRIEQGDVLEHHAGIPSFAHFAIEIEIEIGHLGVPVGIVRRAGGVGGVRQPHAALALEFQPVGFAGRGRQPLFPGNDLAGNHLDLRPLLFSLGQEGRQLLGLQRRHAHRRRIGLLLFLGGAGDRILGLLEVAGALGQVQAQLRAGHELGILVVTDVADRLQFVLDLPVGQLVRRQVRIGLAQFGFALRHHLVVVGSVDARGGNEGGIGRILADLQGRKLVRGLQRRHQPGFGMGGIQRRNSRLLGHLGRTRHGLVGWRRGPGCIRRRRGDCFLGLARRHGRFRRCSGRLFFFRGRGGLGNPDLGWLTNRLRRLRCGRSLGGAGYCGLLSRGGGRRTRRSRSGFAPKQGGIDTQRRQILRSRQETGQAESENKSEARLGVHVCGSLFFAEGLSGKPVRHGC